MDIRDKDLSIEDKLLLWKYYKETGMIFFDDSHPIITAEELLIKLKEEENANSIIMV